MPGRLRHVVRQPARARWRNSSSSSLVVVSAAMRPPTSRSTAYATSLTLTSDERGAVTARRHPGARPHRRPGRPDVRAPARRLGRRRHPGRAAAGEAARRVPRGERHGSDFQNLHRNKRSLDARPEDPRRARRSSTGSSTTADVVVENMRPPVKHALGVDYESVRAVTPHRLRLDLGVRPGRPVRRARRRRPDRPGPRRADERHRPSRARARCGSASPSPTWPPGSTWPSASSPRCTSASASGEGQWVQTSLLEAMIAMLDFQATRWTIDGEVPPQEGNHHPTMIPMGCFATGRRLCQHRRPSAAASRAASAR